MRNPVTVDPEMDLQTVVPIDQTPIEDAVRRSLAES
jgi:dTDP-glucose 4,6-dehydratase